MPATILRKARGIRPLIAMGEKVVVARGRKIYTSDAEFKNLEYLGALSAPPSMRLAAHFRIFRRILRLEPTAAVALSEHEILILCGSSIWSLDILSGKLMREFVIPGGRKALNLTKVSGIRGMEDGVYFGEYLDNVPKNAVQVWFRPLRQPEWRVVFTFPAGEIEHVHSLVADPYRQCLWMLTGDTDSAAAIWSVKENFADVQPALRGSQQYRAAWMYPVENELIYATDSPLEQNYLYRARDQNGRWEIEAIATVPGSSIYAVLSGNRVYFSTTVEPGKKTGHVIRDMLERKIGPGIRDPYVHVYMYSGTGRPLVEILRDKKDWYPPRLCQFGAFYMCTPPDSHKDTVYLYGCAVRDAEGKVLHIAA